MRYLHGSNKEALASALIAETTRAFEARVGDRFRIALTGGSTATTLYPALANTPIDWRAVDIFFGDERCVPADHPDSNYAACKLAFLDAVVAAGAQVFPVNGELVPEEGARDYARTLREVCDGVLDVVHLGVGPDGHVCSLFPGHRLLSEEHALVRSLDDSPKPPPSRVTLTLPALRRARSLWVMAFGPTKVDKIRDALRGDTTLPLTLAVRTHPNVLWFVDEHNLASFDTPS